MHFLLSLRLLGRLLCCVALFALLLFGVGGCGPGKAEVTGTVTFKNQPLPGGTVIFRVPGGDPKTAPRYQGEINPADGTYRIMDVPAGVTYQVTVDNQGLKFMPAPPTGPPGGGDPKFKGVPTKPPEGGTGMGTPPKYVEIPAKYADPEKSGLTFTPKGGKQPYDIPLN
jgi:hypothetical protein